MSTFPKITDHEMRYYQFKARQQFLIRKEDHDWNEFSKKNKCTCCSCQPSSSIQKPLSDKGIQVTANVSSKIQPKTPFKSNHHSAIQDSLYEIRDKLENMNLTLSQLKRIAPYDSEQKLDMHVEEKRKECDSSLLSFTEQKQSLIRTSLINSMQRLQSFVLQRAPKPLYSQVPKRNCSFFLPPDLQKQRQAARKAYLASLIEKPKVKTKKEIKMVNNQKKGQRKKNYGKQQPFSKSRQDKFSVAKMKEKTSNLEEEKTMIQAQSVNEDGSIEAVVDSIVNDLLREEVLAINVIKHKKTGILNDKKEPRKFSKYVSTQTKKEVHLSKLSSEISAKIKQIPFFNLNCEKEKKSRLLGISVFNDAEEEEKKDQLHESTEQVSSSFVNKSQSNLTSKKHYKVLFVDPKLEKEVSKQRKLYMRYLEKTSRSRTYNFDPVTLSNMVSESLLNDCIDDICKELGDAPSSFITDLYNQEFAPTL